MHQLLVYLGAATIMCAARVVVAIDVETTLVGNPGNAPDPVVMGDGTTGYGGVAYEFRISMHEITNAEYAAFLNAVAASDPNALFRANMSIQRTGSDGSYIYAAVAGSESKPITWVSFFDAARFCNWLHNGQPVGPQGPATTEDGAYTMLGPTAIAAGNVDGHGRNNTWLWALPSEHEWHKAAYNGPGNTWTDYATQSNTAPTAQAPPGGVNSANYDNAVPSLTVSGAYPQSVSYWGTFQMNGNLREWNEGSFFLDALRRRIRGGSFSNSSSSLQSDDRGSTGDGTFENEAGGFRVVQTPEPTGACCFKDGSCSNDMTAGDCAATGGTYQGHTVNCVNVKCPAEIGACCLVDGSCVEETTASECAALGGLYRGTGTVCATTGCAPIGPVVYVNAAAGDGGIGTSWAGAFNKLEDALASAAAFPQVVEELWVVAGAYRPDGGTGDRTRSFQLVDDVAVYGGFIGNETTLEQRDPTSNITILTGDLTGNDQFNFNFDNVTFDENAYHVLRCGAAVRAVVDGFTIRSGNASWLGVEVFGGGLWNQGGTIVIHQCTFSWNQSGSSDFAGGGGAVANLNGNLQITNVTFDHNRGGSGGAILNQNASASVSMCQFLSNDTFGFSGPRGSALCHITSTATVSDTLFQMNDHGAVWIEGGSDDDFTACDFISNTGKNGGAVLTKDSQETFDNCLFLTNSTTWLNGSGGAMQIEGPSTIVNCTFDGNSAGTVGGAMSIGSSISGEPLIANCVFQNNTAQSHGGAVSGGGAVPFVITDCQFTSNAANGLGGGMYTQGFAQPVIASCHFQGNSSAQAGGGLYHFNEGFVTLDGSTFSGNSAPLGKGVMNQRGAIGGLASLMNGDDMVNGMNFTVGTNANVIGTFHIDGDYRHAILGGTGDQSPVLFVDIAGTVPGTDFDWLDVNGAVQIDGGSIVLQLGAGYVPMPGQTFDVITAQSVTGEFDLVGVTGAPQGISAVVSYEPGAVRVTIVESATPDYSATPLVAFSGIPSSAVVADMNADGFADLAITVPNDIVTQPGTVLVFRNAGVDSRGQWIGWQSTPLITTVGTTPCSIAASDFNNDGYPELVVANQSSADVSVLQNLGGTGFVLSQNYPAGGEAKGVVVGNLAGNSATDFAVVNKTGAKVRVYRNNGGMVFALAFDLAAGTAANALAAMDLDGDSDLDLLATSPSQFLSPPSLVSVFVKQGGYAPAVNFGVGREPIAIVSALFNANTWPDIATINLTEQSMSLLLNNPAVTNSFLPAVNVPLDKEPLAMTVIDLEPDLDQDFVIVVKESTGPATSLRTVTNTIDPGGEMHLVVNEWPTPNNPALVQGSDVDNDGDQDLVIVNSDAGAVAMAGPSSSIEVFVNAGSFVAGDLNGDGHVGVPDLLMVINAWGPCEASCPADLAPPPIGDGTVSVPDLLFIINNWG